MSVIRVLCVLLMASALVSGLPRAATACALDYRASLYADGVPALLTASGPHGRGPWAPFTIAQAIAAATPVRFTEAQADLARTLPPVMRRAPYCWAFGDGTIAVGHSVTHRYARRGMYIVTVSGFDPVARGWVAFDQAVAHVVPPDQVLWANLGYQALQGVIALSGMTWPLDGVLIVVVLVALIRQTRVQRRGAEGRTSQ